MKLLKKIIWSILRVLRLAVPIQLMLKSVLKENAWFKSYYQEVPVDKKQNRKFHIIVVDSRDRINCLKHGIEMLQPDGVIVFDNSHLDIYTEGIENVMSNEFRHIDFYGTFPVMAHENYTSIFYKKTIV